MNCKECGKEIFKPRWKFCSKECSSKAYAKRINENHNCKICGEKLLIPAWNVCEKCEKENKEKVKLIRLKETNKKLRDELKECKKLIHSLSTYKTNK